MKNIRIFYLKIFIFLVVKFSVYLNRLVFVMNVCCSLYQTTLINRDSHSEPCYIDCALVFHYENTPIQIY